MVLSERASKFLVPFALCAMGLGCLFFAGCKKEGPKSDASSNASESCLQDPEFRGRLAKERSSYVKLVRDHHAVAAQMKAKIEAMRQKLGTDDLEKLRVELEKDPAWNDLKNRCEAAAEAAERQRKDTLETVRRRLAPAYRKNSTAK